MVTGTRSDFIMLFILLLVIVVAVCSLGKPHHHSYTEPTGEVYQRSEHRFEVWACACGKTRDRVIYTGAHNL